MAYISPVSLKRDGVVDDIVEVPDESWDRVPQDFDFPEVYYDSSTDKTYAIAPHPEPNNRRRFDGPQDKEE